MLPYQGKYVLHGKLVWTVKPAEMNKTHTRYNRSFDSHQNLSKYSKVIRSSLRPLSKKPLNRLKVNDIT